jgi:hypothetical protein
MMGNFGNDLFSLNNPGNDVRVEVLNSNDANKLIFGPIVVSWQGRMISGQAFVNPNIQPNTSDWRNLQNEFRIPFRVYVNGKGYSNVDTFYIVKPQKLGNVTALADSIIGQGNLGIRSRRGAMIIDSLILKNRTYRISTLDCDPFTDNAYGNQGYLPCNLLILGNLKGQVATKIDLNGGFPERQDAGPGGAGGGGRFYDAGLLDNGIGENGGHGYTGGGPGGRNNSGIPGTPNAFKTHGTGTYELGKSLNGNPAPIKGQYESSAGGTAHPFGLSGKPCDDGDNCQPVGGYGGASGNRQTLAGGSAGNAIDGMGPNNSKGLAVGNPMNVPFAGGSGGASGNPQGVYTISGNGGGGGGAIRICAQNIEFVSVSANGSTGGNELADGGSGAGGAIDIASKINLSNLDLEVNGGEIGPYKASFGRIRLDLNGGIANVSNTSVVPFIGFSTDTNKSVKRNFAINGKKPANKNIQIFLKSENSTWYKVGDATNLGTTWSQIVTLSEPDSIFYLVTTMDIDNPKLSGYQTEPVTIFSQSAANVFKADKESKIQVSTSKIDFGLSGKCGDIEKYFYIKNLPSATSNLTILKRGVIIGPDKDNFNFAQEPPIIPKSLAPGDSAEYWVRYVGKNGGEGIKTAKLQIETDSPTEPIITIDLVAEREDLHVEMLPSGNINYGNVWAGFTHDTIITLVNKGRLDQKIFDIITSDPDLNVFPYGGTLLANSANSIDFKFSLNSTKTGNAFYSAKFIFEFQCSDTLNIDFVSTTTYAKYTIPDTLDFGNMSPCDKKTDSIYIDNNSQAGFIIKSISSIKGIDSALFTMQNPGISFPDTIYPGQRQKLIFTFNPNNSSDGKKIARIDLNLIVNGIQETKTLYLTGRVSSGLVSIPNSISFGRVVVFTNKTMNFVLENIGPWEVTVSFFTPAAIYPANYTYTNPGTIKLYPGDKLDIPILFSPTIEQDYTDSFEFTYQIGNCPSIKQTVKLIAEGIPAININLKLPKIYTDPNNENLEIPIIATVINPNDTLVGFNIDTLQIKFNRSIFFPVSIKGSGNQIISNYLAGNDRILDIQMRNISLNQRDSVIGYLTGKTMLGDNDSTILDIQKTSFTQKNLVTNIFQQDGEIVLDICKNGGDRLLKPTASGFAGIINPNPTDGEFTLNLNLIESGTYQIVLNDLNGNSKILDEFTIEKNENKFYNKLLKAGDLSSGIYWIKVITPTELFNFPLIIVK